MLAHLCSRPEQVRRIRLRTDKRARMLFTLLAESGLRVGEAVGLRHDDIDAASCLVSVVVGRATVAQNGLPAGHVKNVARMRSARL